MATNPVGYLILTSTPPEAIRGVATRVEELGFGELWVAEDYFGYDGLMACDQVLGATQSIKVGLGIVSGVVRHPAVTAMAISTLSRSYPGRFTPGIGHGVPAWTSQMGLTTKSPLTSISEVVHGVRDLLAGEEVTREGRYFSFDKVKLWHPATEQVPILTGVVGPKSLELSGRIADGTVVSVLAGPNYLADAQTHIAKGLAESGRTSHLLPTFVIAAVDEDREAARASVAATIAFYVATMVHSPLITVNPFGDEIIALVQEGGAELLAANMKEEWIDELAIAGSPADVEAGIRRLLAAGASSVILTFDPATAMAQLELVSETVLPAFAN